MVQTLRYHDLPWIFTTKPLTKDHSWTHHWADPTLFCLSHSDPQSVWGFPEAIVCTGWMDEWLGWKKVCPKLVNIIKAKRK